MRYQKIKIEKLKYLMKLNFIMDEWLEQNEGKIFRAQGKNIQIKNKKLIITEKKENLHDINILDNLITYEIIIGSIFLDIFKVNDNVFNCMTFKNGKRIEDFSWSEIGVIPICHLKDIDEHIEEIKELHKDYDISELLDEIYPNLVK